MTQLILDRGARRNAPPASSYAYHYAADADHPPELIALPAGCGSEWNKTDRRLRLYRGSAAPAIYYCDDGWRFSFGADPESVMNQVRAGRHQLQTLGPGCGIEVTPAGVSFRCGEAHSTPLKVLALVTDGYGAHGGIARYNRDFFEALTVMEAVAQVWVLSRSGSVFSRPKLKQARAIFTKWLYSLRAFAGAFTFRPSLIFCGHLYMTPLAALLSLLFRAPLWVQVHGVEVFEKRGAWIRWALKQASLVTAVSRYTRSKMLEWADIAPERVRVLPNTLDARYQPGDREALKARHGYAGFKIILTVSRLDAREQYKGHDKVLAILPDLLKTCPRLVYLIAGDGSDQRRLERLVSDAGVTPHVHFLGRVSDEQLLELYQMTDVFAMPSTGEGFGIVFLEAAACGCAVVGGDRDGSVDALGEGVIGAAVNPDDPVALRAALRSALQGHALDSLRVSRFRRAHFEHHLRNLLTCCVYT